MSDMDKCKHRWADSPSDAGEGIFCTRCGDVANVSQLRDRIEALEGVISAGFQNMSGRDVADVLIDNANMRDGIRELKSLLDITDFIGIRNRIENPPGQA